MHGVVIVLTFDATLINAHLLQVLMYVAGFTPKLNMLSNRPLPVFITVNNTFGALLHGHV